MWNNPNKLNDPFNHNTCRGILEQVAYYHPQTVILCFRKDENSLANSFGSKLKKLEDDGYIVTKLIEYEKDEDLFQIDSMALTADGEKLLMELRSKDFTNRFKDNFFNLLWVILTAIATTLITLKIKGN